MLLCHDSLHFMFFSFILVFSSLARQCAQLWLKTREMLGFPLGFISEPDHFVLPKGVLEAACGKVSLHVGHSHQLIPCEILMLIVLEAIFFFL